jgi:hypothetical protein
MTDNIKRPFFGILTRSLVPIGTVTLLDDVELRLTAEAIGFGLYRHAMGDWGKVGKEMSRTNQKALEGRDSVVSVFMAPPSDTPFRVVTEGDRQNTFVMLESDYPAFEEWRKRTASSAKSG